ncbi:MAG: hypothetical protein [Microviridae sp.]|nr:MAG: hypothetical protein [Microviridae sp.]
MAFDLHQTTEQQQFNSKKDKRNITKTHNATTTSISSRNISSNRNRERTNRRSLRQAKHRPTKQSQHKVGRVSILQRFGDVEQGERIQRPNRTNEKT